MGQKIVVVRDLGDGFLEGSVKDGRETVAGSRKLFGTDSAKHNAYNAGNWLAEQFGWKPEVEAVPPAEGTAGGARADAFLDSE